MKSFFDKIKIDGFFVFLIFLCNPALWEIKNRISPPFPDSVAYIILSKKLLSAARLYVDQWGHIDHGVILPPVYPFLIGVLDLVVSDGVLSAELVSSFAIILSSIPLYFYIKNLSSRICAFLSIIIIQMNFYYLYFGTLALTEATFIFMLCCGFAMMQKFINSEGKNVYIFYVGILSSLIILTRHVGISFTITVIFFIVYYQFKIRKLYNIFVYIFGIIIIFIPYSFILYDQTGKSYLSQHFRMGDYFITYSEDGVNKPVSVDSSDYQAIYNQRRDQRALLADSSEIISYAVKEKKKETVQTNSKFKLPVNVIGKLSQPKNFLNDIKNNSFHLIWAIGLFNVVVLLFLFIINLFIRINYQPARYLLPFFLFIYLLFMSLITSAVDRYIIVIYPFVVSVLIIELYHFVANFKLDSNRKNLLLALAASLVLFLTPAKSLGIKTYPKDREQSNHLKLCSKPIKAGDPIFTIHPYLAYVLGGSYRILPNDSLEKIAKYASFTGVKWMLLPNLDETKSEYQLYTNAKWILGAENPTELYPDLIKLRCRIDNTYWLFELNPSSAIDYSEKMKN